jgi:uncharacterized DUF497 family protein
MIGWTDAALEPRPMPIFDFLWDGENDDHIDQHGVTIEEFEQVVQDPDATEFSDSSGRPIAFGYTADGRYLACVYEMLDELRVYPITAYEIEE